MSDGRMPYLFFLCVLAMLSLVARDGRLGMLPSRGWDPGMAEGEREDVGGRPSDWFFAQRAYPYGEVNLQAYRDAVRQALAMRGARGRPGGVTWVQAGPTNIGGRITALALDPADPGVVYAGAASGGVLKSTDRGQTWVPLFDEQPTLSIGALAVDPRDPDVVYAGTGEANCGGGSVTYGGLGVYKTTDGGNTWMAVGLEETRYIGRIVVDPQNSNRVYVAAVGTLFSTNPDRGVYRSTDGGAMWEQVLFVSDSTGAIDIVQDPADTDVLYSATWERIRRPGSRRYGGPTSGVYRTTDGGDHWVRLGGGLPSGPDIGRIGLALSPADPATVYAVYADDVGYFRGLYKSTDAGMNWVRVNDSALYSSDFYSSYGWWFGVLTPDPTDADHLFAHGIGLYETTDGGDSWFETAFSNHVDHHAMAIDQADPNRVVEGNDGGVYTSTNGGATWSKSPDLPITQFYTGEIDYLHPERLYGGAQDNGTLRTWTGSSDDWELIYGGDGFYVIVDPVNDNIIYAEYQYGGLGKSTNGGLYFGGALNGVNSSDRRNWSTPVVMDPTDHNTLYYGTYRLYRTSNGAQNWTSISGDLTDGPGGGNLVYHTITTIAVSASDPDVIYAGTDDGNVWVTDDGGLDWYETDAGLPDRWVTRVAVEPVDPMTAYVTLSGFRWDSPLSHVFLTHDGGRSWNDISGGLPEAPVNDIIIDPGSRDFLYVGTDVGVFRSTDGGQAWEDLNEGLPVVPVTDLTLHGPTRTLVASTYGRSMFSVTLPPPVRVEGQREPVSAGGVDLGQNSPNPFNPSTVIHFTMSMGGRVRLLVYNLRGERIRTLASDEFAPGVHEVTWDGRDDEGMPQPSGSYLYRLEAPGRTISRKMLLVR